MNLRMLLTAREEEEEEDEHASFLELDGSFCLSGISAGDGIIIPAWMAVPAATALMKHSMLTNTKQLSGQF